MSGPLAGIRVIDMTAVVVGPICSRMMADQGAEVIKVEAPEGDLLRRMAQGSRNPGMSGKFMQFNRNKRSLALDIKHPEGRAALLRLIEGADVFVSNIRPQALERAGLGWEALRARNPRLIHCSILAFGRGGPYFNRPAYDPIIQSLSGVAGTFERANGTPRFVPMVMTDHITGLIAAQCIGFALYRREKTGIGEAIEVPMFENMASFVMSEHLGAGTFDPPVGPLGDGRLLSPDYRPVATRDGYITVGPNTNAQAFAFFDAIGRPELKTDPRFRDAASRTANAADYLEIRAGAMREKTTAEWLAILGEKDVPCAAYNSLESLLEDPHLAATGFFAAEEHPSEGRIRRTAIPNRFSGGMREEALPAPRLGEQSRAILRQAGLDDATIDRLAEAGVVVMPGTPG
ncbi:CaiB/BaiF CoA transferase family protein [Plastoroseomonas hellenica]|uniref:CaiB/BaiF CoA transferase family protein n=1 Tax=Plastoroseomonas hellenica TaxID=2687306 RepID=UPI001BA870A2|nr:CoA transferase [Plastoroseomonas hellenica]MBR0641611.1 CoA transferase [Plastoroseomonas hellenica]